MKLIIKHYHTHLEKQDSNDEVVKGQPLREVPVVEAEEEESEDEDCVLPRELSPGQPDDLQSRHSHHNGCSTAVCHQIIVWL